MPKQTLETFKEQLEENGIIIRVQLENTVNSLSSIIESTPSTESDILTLQSELETIQRLPVFLNGDTPIVVHNEQKSRLLEYLAKTIDQL